MDIALTEFGSSLKKSGERFVIKRHGQEAVEVPAEDVSHIHIIGLGISMSTDALQLAVEHDTSVSIMTRAGKPIAEFVPQSVFGRAHRRREQLHASEDVRGSRLATSFVSGKLRNQASNLRYFAKSRKESAPEAFAELNACADAVEALLGEIEDIGERENGIRTALMNIEARGAQFYWRGLRAILPEEVGFTARVRQGATDPFNVCLNYGYGILYSRGWNAVARTGLDPYVGFLHADYDGRPTLVFDFVEEFRPFVVDRPVTAAFTKRWRPVIDSDGELEQESRRHLATRILEQVQSRLEHENQMITVDAAITAHAYALAEAVEADGCRKPFVAPW